MSFPYRRVRLISRMVSSGALGLMVFIPLILVGVWALAPESVLLSQSPKTYAVYDLPPLKRALGLLVTLLPAAPGIYGLHQLRILMDAVRREQYFSNRAIVAMKGFAAAALWAQGLKVLSAPLLSLALTYNNPPGEKALAISFGFQFGELALILVAGTFFVISWIMSEAQRLADDNAQIV